MIEQIDLEVAKAYYNRTNTSQTAWDELPMSLKSKFIDMAMFCRVYLISKEILNHKLEQTGPEVA